MRFLQRIAKRIGRLSAASHTLPNEDCVCVCEREKAIWCAIQSVNHLQIPRIEFNLSVFYKIESRPKIDCLFRQKSSVNVQYNRKQQNGEIRYVLSLMVGVEGSL
jgi:hypothetical protein